MNPPGLGLIFSWTTFYYSSVSLLIIDLFKLFFSWFNFGRSYVSINLFIPVISDVNEKWVLNEMNFRNIFLKKKSPKKSQVQK